MNPRESLKKVARQFVPNIGTIVVVLALLWARDAGALGFLAPDAASTSTISYQGRLADSSGNPVTTAGLGMTFRLYNAATGGSALWTETYSGVPVNNGLFHVLLGSVTPIPAGLFSSNNTLYLGITVGADSEMTPREQLASAPYAMQASQALTVPDGSITLAKLGTDAIVKVSSNAGDGFAQVGSSEMAIAQSTTTLAATSSVLVLLSSRAVNMAPNDEFLFHIYRDGAPITDNIHFLGLKDGHQSFSYSFLDTNVSPGTHIYSFMAVMQTGSGPRYIHLPKIVTIAIP